MQSTLNRDVLSREIAKSHDLRLQDARSIVDTTLSQIIDHLQSGGVVTFTGLGTFRTDMQSPRRSRHPKTGLEVLTPEKRVVKFQASNKLKQGLEEVE